MSHNEQLWALKPTTESMKVHGPCDCEIWHSSSQAHLVLLASCLCSVSVALDVCSSWLPRLDCSKGIVTDEFHFDELSVAAAVREHYQQL